MAVGDTILINDISINGKDELKKASDLSKTLKDNTINAFGIDASSRTIWVNGQPYGNAYVNIKEDNTIEAPIGAEIFNDFENNIASGEYSHAEGFMTEAHGKYSHTEGSYNDARGENSILQGHCLFDYELNNKNIPFIWLQLYSETTETITGNASSNNIGCGFIEITGGPFKIKELRGDQYFYGTYYQVEGLFYIKGADGVWRQELQLNDYQSGTNYKYYIKSDDFHKIINSWDKYDSDDSDQINLTDPFYIYSINNVTYDFPYVTQIGVHVKGCDWCIDPKPASNKNEEYYFRITQIQDTFNNDETLKLISIFSSKTDNSKPELSICNNLTVIGQYNKPQIYDIFEVGCGLNNDGKKNAISVNINGFTTIPELNSEKVIVSNIVTVSTDVTSSETESVELPDKSLVLLSTNTINDEIDRLQFDTKGPAQNCKSIICSDGILIGYSQQRYMYLTIEENGNIKLAQNTSDGLKEVKITFK